MVNWSHVIDDVYLDRQRKWSEETFGPYPRMKGVIDHIKKELKEIEESDNDLSEWVDIIVLGFDGALGTGASSQEILDALHAKMTVNFARHWPDWRTVDRDKAIEHDRSDQLNHLVCEDCGWERYAPLGTEFVVLDTADGVHQAHVLVTPSEKEEDCEA